MPITATVSASVALSGAVAGPENIAVPQITNATSLDVRRTLTLPAGFSSFGGGPAAGALFTSAELANSKGVWIIPAAGNATTLTLKGVTADTGTAISKTNPTMLTWDTAPTTSGITAGDANGVVTFVFF